MALALSGCQADIDAPQLQVPEATMTANTTIAELKTIFADVTTVGMIGTKPNGDHYIVKGRVVSSDATGNIYQQLYIQDETAALPFSIGRASLYNIYPVGQEVIVDLTGLYIGQYGEMQQIGDYYESGGEAQPGRMLYPRFKEHSQMNGLPNFNFKYVKMGGNYPSADPYCIITTIEELPSAGEEMRNITGQLVEFHNVRFQEAGKEDFAPYQETVNRTLVDQQGNTIVVRNSGYSTFYNQILPEGEGTVRGILTYYSGTWQLLLRSTQDILFGTKGKREDPYTVPELISLDNNGQSGWVEGYIVGGAKAGVSKINSNSDVIFGNEGLLFEGNILLAPKADCRDIAQCIAVQLPQGTRLRQMANLVDNPEVLGKKMKLTGDFDAYLGIHGLTNCPGTLASFQIEGVEVPEGTGSEDSPYSCSYVISNYEEGGVAWVEGYVVGFVSGTDYFGDGALTFGPYYDGADYNNQNVILAPDANCTDPQLCIVVKTSQKRNELGLKANPAIYGKYLKVEGELGTYLNRAAVTTVVNYSY